MIKRRDSSGRFVKLEKNSNDSSVKTINLLNNLLNIYFFILNYRFQLKAHLTNTKNFK